MTSPANNGHPPRSSNAAAIGQALWDSADFSGAERHFERALQEEPKDIEALHGLGKLKLIRNDLPAAVLLIEQAYHTSLRSTDARPTELTQRIRRDLAWTLYRLDRFDLAAEHFEQLPGQEALAAQLRAFGTDTPYRFALDHDEIAVPFIGTFPLPIIVLGIGGKEHAFVLDTGSGQLVIDSSLSRAMGLPDYGAREVRFASGQPAPVNHTIVPEVWLGDLRVEGIPAEVVDVRRFAPQLSGFIGTNFLQRFHVLADFAGQRLRLRPPGAPFFEEGGEMTPVPVWLFDDHLLLAPAKLNDHETIAYVTSGMAGGAFSVPQSSVRQAQLEPLDEEIEGVGAAGTERLQAVRADKLCLGNWCRRSIEGFSGFFPAELEWRYGFRVGALVAHEFLKTEQWAIDFRDMNMYHN